MSNRHFGRISEVWKHLVLAEVLAVDRPTTVHDTHAGDALHPLVQDAERSYGVRAFDALAADDRSLRGSAYVGVLSTLRRGGALTGIPGGPLVAMAVLGNTAKYVFCDLDPGSTANIRDVARQRGVHTANVLNTDGMASVHDALLSHDSRRTVVFIDPFDHYAPGLAGLSPLDVAEEASRAGAVLVYWYGYNRSDERGWLFDVLTKRAAAGSWWCGDVMLTAEGGDMTAGDLGAASSPGTGFGLVCANASKAAVDRCSALGTSLARAYRGHLLPTNEPGSLDVAFWVRSQQA